MERTTERERPAVAPELLQAQGAVPVPITARVQDPPKAAPMTPEQRWTVEQIDLMRRTVAKDTTPDEFAYFLYVAMRTGLDPLGRQIYCIVRMVSGGGQGQPKQRQLTIQTGIDGFRVIAARSGKYAGQLPTEWCGPDGRWRDVWLESTPPAAARVRVLRRDFAEPLTVVALFREYAQYAGYGQERRLTTMWGNMPANQLAKCAEAKALRQAFPQDLSGLYAEEEMQQADSEPAQVVAVKDAAGEQLQADAKLLLDARGVALPEVPGAEWAAGKRLGEIAPDGLEELRSRFQAALDAGRAKPSWARWVRALGLEIADRDKARAEESAATDAPSPDGAP